MYVVAVYIFEIYVNFTTTKKEQRNADDRCHFSELNLLIKRVENGHHIFILSNIYFICFNCLFQIHTQPQQTVFVCLMEFNATFNNISVDPEKTTGDRY